MCPYFSLWHVSCVLESCVYRYALECVFVYLSWFILSCKILIMWYMHPPPRFLMRCASLHLLHKCCTSEVFHLTWCLPLSTCRWPWPFLHQWLSLAPSSSQDSWPTRPHLRVSEKKMAEKSQAVDSSFDNYFKGRLDGHQFIPVISILNIFRP